MENKIEERDRNCSRWEGKGKEKKGERRGETGEEEMRWEGSKTEKRRGVGRAGEERGDHTWPWHLLQPSAKPGLAKVRI